jgi:hypothetical protein
MDMLAVDLGRAITCAYDVDTHGTHADASGISISLMYQSGIA